MSIKKLASGEELSPSEIKAIETEWNEAMRSLRLLRGIIAGAGRHVQADELTVYGDADIGSDLTVGGDAEIGDTLDVAGDAHVVGIFDVGGNADFGASINVVSDANIHGNLTVDGTGIIGSTSNYTQWNSSGSQTFVGNAGLQFGEIYANTANSSHAISSAGEASKVQIAAFDTNGVSNGMTPDKDQNHIVVTTTGKYLCTASLHVESAGGGGADLIGVGAYKNNGATQFANIHGHRLLAGGGGDTGSMSLSGVIAAASSDTIELWIWNEDSTDDVVVDDVTLSMMQIGG